MPARPRLSSREHLQRHLQRLLALAGSYWQFLAMLGDCCVFGTLRASLASSCQELPRAARNCQKLVRPRGFEPMTCGSGGNRTQVVSLDSHAS